MKKSEVTRGRIIEATMTTLQEKGIQALTLEEVARRAEVSKGGLLYHFKSKEELLKGTILAQKEQDRLRYEALLEQGIGKLEAFVVIFEELHASRIKGKSPLDPETLLFLLTLFDADDAFATDVREKVKRYFEEICDSVDPVESMIIRYALDGFMMSQHFGLPILDAARQGQFMDRLKERARKIDQETERGKR